MFTTNTKEHYQLFIRKNTKSIKQSKINTYQQKKKIKKTNIFFIKSVVTEHPKTLHKFSKTIRRAKKVSQLGSNSSLYNNAKKEKYLERQK